MLNPGDTIVLSSHPIPGNEEAISKTINRLIRRGAEVVYEAVLPVHVSGHASSEEQKLLLNLVRPKFFVPIHGELHQLKRHAVLAHQVGIPEENFLVVENGQVIELAGWQAAIWVNASLEVISSSKGKSVGEIDLDVMREREQLARSGIVLITITLDKYSNRLIKEPEVLTRGSSSPDDADRLIPAIQKKVNELVNGGGVDNEKLISDTVRSLLYNETRRRPMVFTAITKA